MSYANSTADNAVAWEPEEDKMLQELVRKFGNKWQHISKILTKEGTRPRSVNSARNRHIRLENGLKRVGARIAVSCVASGEMGIHARRKLEVDYR